MARTLGYETQGNGPRHVLVMHDWFSDRSSWDPVRPFLSNDSTYAFVDFRGYGASRDIEGSYTLDEASTDVLALADALRWDRFSAVGHSMSTLVLQKLLQLAPERVAKGVLITPVPPTGMRLDDHWREMSRKLALADDERRVEALRQFWGPRLGDRWIQYKARRWSETAVRSAAAAYVDMYGRTDISEGARGIRTPLLVVACEQDSPPFRGPALREQLLPDYPGARLASIADSSHYPMQETPPLLAALLEGFLGESA